LPPPPPHPFPTRRSSDLSPEHDFTRYILLLQFMQCLTLGTELHTPHVSIILRPPMRSPQIEKPLLARVRDLPRLVVHSARERARDRKSTRLNSSHVSISY